MQALEQQLSTCRVLPVVTADDVATTVQLAKTLHRGGISAIEITLRTAPALASLAAVKEALPDMLVAAGTVISAQTMDQALAAGADLCVSPGISEALLVAAAEREAALLPGVATASEVMLGVSHGYRLFKLFPAAQIGGAALLRAFAGPFPDVRFCPTGGLTPENFRDFLRLQNVFCCGGSWMVARTLVERDAWDEIETLARDALS